MSKRFTDTGIWEEDWFYEIPIEYKLFWFYLKDNCDHAGIWRPKTRVFAANTGVDISLDKALEYINMDKQRIRVLPNGRWFIEDFFVFQYGNKINTNSRVHQSACQCYEENNIPLSSIRGISHV